MLELLALIFLGTTLAMVTARRIDRAVLLLAGQSSVLAAVALLEATHSGALHGYVAFALTVIVKVVAVPVILFRVLRGIRVKREIELVLPVKAAFVMAIGIVLLSYRATSAAALSGGVASSNAVPVALASALIGLFLMIVRKKALSQMIGLLVMENGFYLAALVVTAGLPIVVEIGVAFDLLVAVVVMGVFTDRIHRAFDTIDTDRLRGLRG